jgi:hypothetical protein
LSFIGSNKKERAVNKRFFPVSKGETSCSTSYYYPRNRYKNRRLKP